MSEYIFRKASKADIAPLVDLMYKLNIMHDVGVRPSEEKLAKDWENFEAWVVEVEGEIVAYVTGYNTYQMHVTVMQFEIQNLYVKENHRRKGLAELLLKNMIKEKSNEGVERFGLGVSVDNAGARALYESLGFIEGNKGFMRYKLADEKLQTVLASYSHS